MQNTAYAHYLTSVDLQVIDGRNLVLHFFIKQLTFEQFLAVEKGCPLSKDYGQEVSGSTFTCFSCLHLSAISCLQLW